MSVLNRVSANIEKQNQLLSSNSSNFQHDYSDQAAWLMAVFSELSYQDFIPFFQHRLAEPNRAKSCHTKSSKQRKNNSKQTCMLSPSIMNLRFALCRESMNIVECSTVIQVFETKLGADAILAETPFSYVLAFRGTEFFSLSDLKTNIKATLIRNGSSGRVHKGFFRAYQSIENSLIEALSRLRESKMLIITGHSLGGALATITVKELESKYNIAACYTFGAPRVGNQAWCSEIKTKIYRVVNAADPVTMLPPNGIGCLKNILSTVPLLGTKVNDLLAGKFFSYTHAGEVRYLTNCKKNHYSEVQLLSSVSLFYWFKAILIGRLPLKKVISDHSITVYRKKLAIIALQCCK